MEVENKIKDILKDELCKNPEAMSISEGTKIDIVANRIAFILKEFIQWKDMEGFWGKLNVRNIGHGYYDIVGEEHGRQYVIDELFGEWIKKKTIGNIKPR